MTPRAPVTKERVEELREWLTTVEEVWGPFDALAHDDLLAILSDYSSLRAENILSQTVCGELRREIAAQGTLILAMKGHHPSVDKLKAENERLSVKLGNKDSELLIISNGYMKAEADLLAAQMTNAKNGAIIIEQMAQLAKQAPLVQAVMGAETRKHDPSLDNLETALNGRMFRIFSAQAILRAALKLREEKGNETGQDGAT